MKPRVLLYTLPPSGGDFFPVSLGYIAASLEAHNIDAVVAEVDEVTKRTGEEVANFIIEYKPHVVGFSVYQVNIKLALQLARIVKMIDPSIVVIFGGPQATCMPHDALRTMRQVDVIMRGEAELRLPALVRCIVDNTDASHIKGIVYMQGDVVFETSPASMVGDLDMLPSPYANNVFDFSQHEAAAMLTSRGCCYTCAFCYTPRAFGRRIRMHSPRRVLSDMSICVKAGVKRFFFADPSFTFDKKRVASIMRGIVKKGWKVEIWCETRSDLIDRTLMRLMAKAGVRYIAYGLESADLNVNRILRKPIDLAQFENVIRMTKEEGIEPEVFTLYGLPGQTPESCFKTLDFLKRLEIPVAWNSAGQQLHLFFGTDITDAPARYGIRLLKKRRPLYLSAGTDFVTEHMKRSDIARVRKAYEVMHPKHAGKGTCISLLDGQGL
ncbi:MAG TPA: radical SAM protein [Candidatus Omnitrophota bacterium]|nr:radical SAM protein [Candidatus Omnitrophota bacterium]HPT07572.1 radical SAM protein [Candidatus Omnitrophota bacterium]